MDGLLDEAENGELTLEGLCAYLEGRAQPDLVELWLAARQRLADEQLADAQDASHE